MSQESEYVDPQLAHANRMGEIGDEHARAGRFEEADAFHYSEQKHLRLYLLRLGAAGIISSFLWSLRP